MSSGPPACLHNFINMGGVMTHLLELYEAWHHLVAGGVSKLTIRR